MLDGVADQVVEHLLDLGAVDADDRQHAIDERLKGQPLFAGRHPVEGHAFFQGRSDIGGRRVDLKTARFDHGKVEKIVDDPAHQVR